MPAFTLTNLVPAVPELTCMPCYCRAAENDEASIGVDTALCNHPGWQHATGEQDVRDALAHGFLMDVDGDVIVAVHQGRGFWPEGGSDASVVTASYFHTYDVTIVDGDHTPGDHETPRDWTLRVREDAPSYALNDQRDITMWARLLVPIVVTEEDLDYVARSLGVAPELLEQP